MNLLRNSIPAILITLASVLTLSAQDVTISTISTTPVTCGLGSDGTITVTVTGGTGPYSYLLTKGAVPVEGADNIASQTFTFTNHDKYTNYWVIVSDSEPSTGGDLAFATIDGPNPIAITSFSGTDITCNNVNDGTLRARATGEGGNYVFDLSGPAGQTNETGDFSGLIEGIYTVTVSDKDGCPSTDVSSAITIHNPDPVAISVDKVTDVTCFGEYTGSISISPSGGTPLGLGSGYTYEWTGPDGFSSGLEDLTFRSAGDYFVTVFDRNHCTEATGPIVIKEPDELAAALNGTSDATCNGGSDGTATITVSGGSGAYTFSWDGQLNGLISTEEDPVNLPADVYNLTVYDSNGCSKTFFSFATIGEPSPFLITLNGIADVSCAGGNNGSASITVDGGTPGYTYLWTGSNSGYTSAAEDPSNLPADSYDLTLTDSRGCTELFDAILIITEPNPFSLLVIGTSDVSCHGGNDGRANITLGGGTPPYIFDWVGAGTGHTSSLEDPDDLVADTYTLNVTDNNGCMQVFNALLTVGEPAELMVTVDNIVDVNCQGGATGAIEISIQGGTPPYAFAWSGPNGFISSLEDLSNLESGDYNLTLTDSRGCSKVYTGIARVNENTSIVASFSKTNVSCYGGTDGSITTIVSGGTPGYTFLWLGPGGTTYPTKDLSGVVAGSYQLTITDALGCIKLMPALIISEPPPITATTSKLDADCFGAATGSINLTPASGVPPYIFVWTGPDGFTATTEDIAGLEAGTYSVGITDANGCSVFLASIVTILEPEEIQVLQESISGENFCFGESLAQISIDQVTGGLSPYAYSINGGIDFYPAHIFPNLAAGDYQTVVRDATGCSAPGKLNVITQPAELEISSYSQAEITSCFDAPEGQIDIKGSGGTGSITYILNGSTTNSTGNFIDLRGGPYAITLQDENGCTLDTAVVILSPPPISVDNISVTDVSGCNGDATGAVTVTGSGGTGAITYALNGGAFQASGTFNSLMAGNYTVTLKDANDCTRDTVISISQPAVISIGSALVTPITCHGAGNGLIEISGAGGTPPLTYTLNPGAIVNNTGIFIGLSPGSYTVSIDDSEACAGTDTLVTLTDPPVFVLDTVNTRYISCNGVEDGQISIAVSGGIPPYLFSVDNQATWNTGTVFTALPPGTYEVYAKDVNQCTLYGGSITLTDPPQITASVVITDITSCSGDTTGTLEIMASGGTGKLLYSLDGITYDSSGIFHNLPAGLYTVYVQDTSGCSYTTPAPIDEPDPLTANISKTDATYGNPGSITIGAASGGTPPYEYSIGGPGGPFTGDTLYTGLEAATYLVIVRDLNHCTYEEMVNITDVPPLEVVVNVSHISCFGLVDGSIEFVPRDAEGAVIYSIDSGQNFVPDPLFENLPANVTYFLVAIDDAGKVFTGEVVLQEPAKIILSPNITPAECNAFSQTGSIDVTVTGGSGSYTYLWSDGSTEEDQTNISAGIYILETMDANNCGRFDTMLVISEVSVYAYAGEDTTVCFGTSLQLVATGGHIPSWDPSPFIADPNDANPVTLAITQNTTFILTITEETSVYGCYNTDSLAVSLFPQTGIEVTEDTFIIVGTSVPLEANGGPFFEYRWEPEAGLSSATIPNPMATPIESIRYYVYGTNEFGCEETDSVYIEVIENLKAFNAFSPNGDGINEYFEIENSERFPEMLVEIYNRWGSLLYSTVGYDSGRNWDGTYNGKEAPVGTYYFIIIPYSGAKPITGNVTIIR